MSVLSDTGKMAADSAANAGYSVRLLLRTILSLGYLPRRFRFTLDMAYSAGVRALPVTLIVALFAGMILALQTGIELKRLGQSNLIGTITALSMCREMGPFITGIILAAMVGSAMAAEVGTMTVSDEVTALNVMSVDPVNYLALPRIVALTLMCPILTCFSNVVGIFGGSIVAAIHLDVTSTLYWSSVSDALTSPVHWYPKDIFTGLAKAVVFGCAVSTVSVSAGLRATGGALGVGLAVQRAVMQSVILTIVLGFIMTQLFYFRG